MNDPIISVIKHLSAPVFGEILNFLEFPQIIQISKQYRYGHLTILPHIDLIYTPLPTINPHNLTKCCGVKHLIMPHSSQLDNSMLLMLPNLESLIIQAGSRISGDVFQFIPLKTLEILSRNAFEVDTVLTHLTVQHFKELENLHIRNNKLRDDDFASLRNLKILILWNPHVTPAILNYLPQLELCLLNGTLIKWCSNDRTRKVIKKIGKLKAIQIYGLSHHSC